MSQGSLTCSSLKFALDVCAQNLWIRIDLNILSWCIFNNIWYFSVQKMTFKNSSVPNPGGTDNIDTYHNMATNVSPTELFQKHWKSNPQRIHTIIGQLICSVLTLNPAITWVMVVMLILNKRIWTTAPTAKFFHVFHNCGIAKSMGKYVMLHDHIHLT